MKKFLISHIFFASFIVLMLYSTTQNDCFADDTNIYCVDSTTTVPPFYVSDAYKQGDRIYENLRSLDNKSIIMNILPKGSIVHVDQKLYNRARGNQYLPVEVVSTLPANYNQRIIDHKDRRNRFNYLVRGSKHLKQASIGAKGYLVKNALKASKNYRFELIKDSILYNRINKDKLPNINLSLKMHGPFFEINRCCQLKASNKHNDKKLTCYDNYKYNVFQGNIKIKEIAYSNSFCHMQDSLIPIPNNDIEDINNLLKIINKTYNDLVTLPKYKHKRTTIRPFLIKFPIKDFKNVFHYKRDDKKSNDLFLRPETACALSLTIKEFEKRCKKVGCQVQIGDMYHNNMWGVHHSHDSGKCLDIRPFRKRDDQNVGLTYKNRRYDVKKTCQFMRTAQKFGASYIEFGDLRCKKRRYGSVWSLQNSTQGRHNDHIHICFNSSKIIHRHCK